LTVNFDRLALETSPAALFRHPPQISFQSEVSVCGCGGSLLVQKTRRKVVFSIFGPFTARETVRLPLYSPELNPVEHLWDEIREKRFVNRVFDSMGAVITQALLALVE